MKGRSQFDRRHVVGLSWMWERAPVRNPVVNALAAGWTVSGVHNWSSGSPLKFTMGIDVALDGTGGAGRQLAMCATARGSTTSRGITQTGKTSSTRSSNERVHAGCVVPLGTYGNVPKSAISGPARRRRISRCRGSSLPGRDVRLQFRGELFNAFNQVNFSAPSTTANRRTSAESPLPIRESDRSQSKCCGKSKESYETND